MHINDVVLKVRYGETDQMGVAYHGNYFTWFEVGRSEFFNSLGYTYKKLEEEGIILPVIECSCEYIKPAKYFDEIIIRTKIDSLKGIRMVFNYEIIGQKDKTLLARGRTSHAFVDKKFKPVKIKRLNKEVWDILERSI